MNPDDANDRELTAAAAAAAAAAAMRCDVAGVDRSTETLHCDLQLTKFTNNKHTTHNTDAHVQLAPHYAPAPRVGALSDDARLKSDVCLSVTYIGPKLRIERPIERLKFTEYSEVLGHHFQDQKV